MFNRSAAEHEAKIRFAVSSQPEQLNFIIGFTEGCEYGHGKGSARCSAFFRIAEQYIESITRANGRASTLELFNEMQKMIKHDQDRNAPTIPTDI